MSSPHITLSNKLCIFCQQRPESGERITAVLDCSASKGHTSSFIMPLVGQANTRYQDVYTDAETLQCQLCLRPGCGRCVSSPKSILYHSDCYHAFQALWKRNGIELLPSKRAAIYEIGLSLHPWLPPAEKPRIYSNTPGAYRWWSWALEEISALSVRPTALSLFVNSLSALPLELLGLILVAGESEIYKSALLRHVLVFQIATLISGQANRSQNSRSSCAQAAKPTLEFLGNQYLLFKEDAGDAKPLGVDHLGVRSTSGDCPWYLQSDDLELSFKHPFLRPSLDRPLELWNVLTRPENGSYRFHGADETKSNPQQIQCVNFSELVALTIVCAGRVVYAIHEHDNHHSSAIDTYLSLSPSAQKVALLLYFPLNSGRETINEVWVRESLPFPERNRTIMIRTSQRTQIFGPNNQHRRCHYFPIACGLATSLLYHVPVSGDPISVFGAVSTSSSLPEPNAGFNGGGTSAMYRSQASLKDVAHIEAYIHILEGTRCSGILVKHDDGREEALGQRRVGLSSIQTISIYRPSRMHYRRFQTSNGHWHLKVVFSTNDNPKLVDAEKGWMTQVMTGMAVWSFDWRSDQLQFYNTE